MIRERLRQATRAAGFGALTIAAGASAYANARVTAGDERRKVRGRDFVSGSWARGLLRLFGVQMTAHGDPGRLGLERGHGRVIIANHRSIIDIAVLLSEFGGSVLSRGEMRKWPIIGPASAAAGTLFVDRSSKESGASAINTMVAQLQKGDTVSLFPEGTTFVDDEVRPFKLGAFVAAHRAGVPVLPVGLAYPLDSGAAYGGETFVSHLARLAASTGSSVHVEIGPELRPAHDETVEQFAERCRAEVARLVALARASERRAAR